MNMHLAIILWTVQTLRMCEFYYGIHYQQGPVTVQAQEWINHSCQWPGFKLGQPVESGISTWLNKSADCQSEAMLEYCSNVVILKDSQKNLCECKASFEANLMSMSWSDVTVFPCCSSCVSCSSASVNFVIIWSTFCFRMFASMCVCV